MMTWQLTRTEGEWLVELIEKQDAMRYLADELRELFGMRTALSEKQYQGGPDAGKK